MLVRLSPWEWRKIGRWAAKKQLRKKDNYHRYISLFWMEWPTKRLNWTSFHQEIQSIHTLSQHNHLTKLSNWIWHRMQLSSNPWNTQNASCKLRSYDSCMIWDICVLNSWPTQKQDIIFLIDRRLARLPSVSTVLKTGFGDTFVLLCMWLSFYECTGTDHIVEILVIRFHYFLVGILSVVMVSQIIIFSIFLSEWQKLNYF